MNSPLNYITALILFSVLIHGENFYKDGHGLLNLNASDFQRAIDEHKTLVALIYIKDIAETNSIVKTIEKVGEELQKRSIPATLAKYPVQYNNEVYARYNLEGDFGLVAIMDHGERFVEYTQEIKDVDKIIEFIEKKMLDPVKEINDGPALRLIIENRPCVSVGFFQNFSDPIFEEYKSSADWFYECDHFITKDEDMFKYFHVENSVPTIKFYKECIHEVFDYPKQLPLDSSNILKYFLACMEPIVSPFGMNWLMKRVIVPPQFTLLLFVNHNDTKKQTYIDILRKYGRRYREEINMAYIEIGGKEEISTFMYTFDLTEKDVPCIRAIETANRFGNNTRKYKPRKKTINDASVKQFIGEVYYRQLKPYLISDKLPKDWDRGPIVTIVGDNFLNVTGDEDKSILIVFYRDENRLETFVKGQLRELANHFQTIGRTDIVIGQSNYYSNEYFGWHPQRFPNIILFPKGKNSYGIEFQMDLTYEDMKLFIESDGQINQKQEKKKETKPAKEEKETSIIDSDDEGEVEEVPVVLSQTNQTHDKEEL